MQTKAFDWEKTFCWEGNQPHIFYESSSVKRNIFESILVLYGKNSVMDAMVELFIASSKFQLNSTFGFDWTMRFLDIIQKSISCKINGHIDSYKYEKSYREFVNMLNKCHELWQLHLIFVCWLVLCVRIFLLPRSDYFKVLCCCQNQEYYFTMCSANPIAACKIIIKPRYIYWMHQCYVT